MERPLADNRLESIMIEVETVLSNGVIEETLAAAGFKETLREQWKIELDTTYFISALD